MRPVNVPDSREEMELEQKVLDVCVGFNTQKTFYCPRDVNDVRPVNAPDGRDIMRFSLILCDMCQMLFIMW